MGSTLRAYYWHQRVKGPVSLFWKRHVRGKHDRYFRVGNAGDIFARDLIAHFYPDLGIENCDAAPRLLPVGSIAHRAGAGDVLAGAGCKTRDVPGPETGDILIHGLRGPLSYDIMKSAGHDVSKIRFLADPGLMIAQMMPEIAPTPGRVIFIPHYRERAIVRKLIPKQIKLIDIDDTPRNVAAHIQSAELVYASSLHGIIFAHALGRPCILVKPMTEEPLMKYEDHYLSMGLTLPTPLERIDLASFKGTPPSPATLNVSPDDITFPDVETLRARGIVR